MSLVLRWYCAGIALVLRWYCTGIALAPRLTFPHLGHTIEPMRYCRLFLGCVLSAKVAAAQQLRTTIVDSASDVGVSGALVSLLGSDNRPRDVQVTNRAGFVFLHPDTVDAAGGYRLYVRRIGFKPWTSGFIRLGATDTIPLRLAVPLVRITLATIVVRGKQCGPTDANPELAAAWDQVKTALDLAIRADSIPELDLRIQRYQRDALRGSPAQLVRSIVAPARGQSFLAMPTDSLELYGYLQLDGDNGRWIFNAPDANTLLSPQFERSHCFRLAPSRSQKDTTITIEFEPATGRLQPEIAGELRIRRANSALMEVTFRYIQIPQGLPPDNARGFTAFTVQQDGWAYVREWGLHYPFWYVKDHTETQFQYGILGSRTVGGAAWPASMKPITKFRSP